MRDNAAYDMSKTIVASDAADASGQIPALGAPSVGSARDDQHGAHGISKSLGDTAEAKPNVDSAASDPEAAAEEAGALR